ncbi:site-specific integrase [candidate division KSB1 bacterium]|nr:site-specific integrase [candidate division KSB1 bacterium]
MSVYKKSRKDGSRAWFYDFSHNGVRYRGVAGSTKTQALIVQDKIRAKVLNGEYDLKDKYNNQRFEDFAQKYSRRNSHLRSYKRIKIFLNNLTAFFSGNVLSNITANEIEEYKSKRLVDGVTKTTVNRELECLRRMYNLAVKWGDAKTNPVNNVDFFKEPPGRTRYLTLEDAKSLLDNCNVFLKPVVFTALNTGMRLSEILTLRWNQVHIRSVIDPYIELSETKSNKKRSIPLNDDMVELLNQLYPNDSEYVFLNVTGMPFKSVKISFHTALKKSEILDFRFHDLRHTFASHFIMNGGDLLTLKEILGHSSLKMVARYTHLAQKHKLRQINNLVGKFKNATYLPPERKMSEKI